MKYFRIVILLLMFFTGAFSMVLGFLPAAGVNIDSDSLMAKINQERANRNIPVLLTSSQLSSAASAKTADMFKRAYFDHVDPDGRYVWFRIEAAGYKPYKTLGENLAIDFSTEDGIVRAWINSPSHRDNLLNSAFADQGLSAQYGDYQSRYTSIVTSLFGALITKAVSPATVPPAQNQALALKPQQLPESVMPAEVPNQPEAPSKSEPAISLSTVSEKAEISSPTFATFVPAGLVPAERDTYATLRWMFIFLTSIFILTYLLDIFKRVGLNRAFAKKNQLPILFVLALICLLTVNLY